MLLVTCEEAKINMIFFLNAIFSRLVCSVERKKMSNELLH